MLMPASERAEKRRAETPGYADADEAELAGCWGRSAAQASRFAVVGLEGIEGSSRVAFGQGEGDVRGVGDRRT